jgi:hypothetical protein
MGAKEISMEVVATRILLIRGKRVMLDRDLAQLYGVKTKVLLQSVKRNLRRFPEDFMFQLTKAEAESLRSQIVTLNDTIVNTGVTASKRGRHIKYLPFVFTEQGVAMQSCILNSERAIQMNIAIVRTFVRIRELFLKHKDLSDKLDELERKYQLHETDIQVIFQAIKKLLEPPPDEPPKPRFGMN